MEMTHDHEAHIQRLRQDLKVRQARQPTRHDERARAVPPIIDSENTLKRRVIENLRVDPNDLLPLGEPDNPTPPFAETIMNARISKKFEMPTIKSYDGTGDPANHVRTFSNPFLL